MMAWRAALEQVFHLHDNPQDLDAMRYSPLPEGMASLMRLVSDSGALLEEVARSHAMPASQLQAYIAEYLSAVCLYPHSSPLRVLGLNEIKNMALAKEHHRLLLKWLHPDRNPHHKQYAERVNQAWTALKNQYGDAEQALNIPEFSADRHDHLPLPKSRFPMFLVASFSLAGLLLAVSFWPDDAVYVNGSESAVPKDTNSESGNDKNDIELSWLERLKKPRTPINKPLATTAAIDSPAVTNPKPMIQEKTVAGQVLTSAQNTPPVLAQQQPKPLVQLAMPSAENTEIAVPMTSQSMDKKIRVSANSVDENPVSDVEQAQHLLTQFSQAYQQGNLAQFMALFSTQARNNRGDRLAIEQDYRNLFSQSKRRSIRFTDLQWRQQAKLELRAQYHTQVKWQNRWMQVAHHGGIQFMFIHENGKLHIQQILLGE